MEHKGRRQEKKADLETRSHVDQRVSNSRREDALRIMTLDPSERAVQPASKRWSMVELERQQWFLVMASSCSLGPLMICPFRVPAKMALTVPSRGGSLEARMIGSASWSAVELFLLPLSAAQ